MPGKETSSHRPWLGRVAVVSLLIATSLIAVAQDVRAAATIRIPADFATLAEAVDAAKPGDTILVAPGTYPGGVRVFTPDLKVVSEAGPALTILDLDPHPGRITVDSEATGFKIEGFTIEGADTSNAIDSVAGDTIVRNNTFARNYTGSGSIVEMRLGGTIRSNLFTGNSCYAVAELDNSALFVNNLVVNNPNCGGVEVGEGSVEVVNNTFVGNDFALHLEETTGELRNNIVHDNRYSVSLNAPAYPVGLHTNLFWDSPPYDEQDDPAGWNGNIAADPRLSVNKPG